METCYESLKKYVFSFKEKGKVILLDNYNATFRRSVQVNDIIGIFVEDRCNDSGNYCIYL